MKKLLPEIFAGISRPGRFLEKEHSFGRTVGTRSCVPTGEGDQIVYAQRPGRKGLTRFVKGREEAPSDTAVVVLKKDERKGHYILITAFIGRKSALEPWDERATDKDRDFWSCHALV